MRLPIAWPGACIGAAAATHQRHAPAAQLPLLLLLLQCTFPVLPAGGLGAFAGALRPALLLGASGCAALAGPAADAASLPPELPDCRALRLQPPQPVHVGATHLQRSVLIVLLAVWLPGARAQPSLNKAPPGSNPYHQQPHLADEVLLHAAPLLVLGVLLLHEAEGLEVAVRQQIGGLGIAL